MLIVTEHQREGENGTYVATAPVICKSGPVDRSKINGEGWGAAFGFCMVFPKAS